MEKCIRTSIEDQSIVIAELRELEDGRTLSVFRFDRDGSVTNIFAPSLSVAGVGWLLRVCTPSARAPIALPDPGTGSSICDEGEFVEKPPSP